MKFQCDNSTCKALLDIDTSQSDGKIPFHVLRQGTAIPSDKECFTGGKTLYDPDYVTFESCSLCKTSDVVVSKSGRTLIEHIDPTTELGCDLSGHMFGNNCQAHTNMGFPARSGFDR